MGESMEVGVETSGVEPAASDAARISDPAAAESDAREERMDRVAVLYAHITAATRDFLAAVAECDRHRDWSAEGFGSCAEWLAWRVGLGHNAATERVRVARALERLPLTSEAMSSGALSFSKVRALTRVATPEIEAELLTFARAGSTAKLERMVRAWKTLCRDDEQKRERLLHGTRRLSVVPDGDGMYVVRGRLSAEDGALLMRALEAASDALYAGSSEEERTEIEPAQRRADALGLLAERALAAGLAGGFGEEEEEADGEVGAPDGEDPDCGGCGRAEPAREGSDGTGNSRAEPARPEPGRRARISGSGAGRYQVVLYVEPATVAEAGEPGVSELDDGTRVSAETARRIACDAALVTVQRGANGDVLDVGRRTRRVPPALRRALDARDRGCRFPGCACRFTAAHHIVHWADGGATKLDNLVLLCRRHHRRVHEDGWRVCSDRTGANIVFFTPDGRALADAPPMPEPRSLDLRSAAAPDWRTNMPTHRYDDLIPWDIEAAAWEALDSDEAA
jgi:hypothetical protein